MTQSETVILAAAIGAIAGVLGAVIGGIISYFAQRGLLRRELRHALTRELFQKRLAALQNLVFAIDFIERMRDHAMADDFSVRTWHPAYRRDAVQLWFYSTGASIRFRSRRTFALCWGRRRAA